MSILIVDDDPFLARLLDLQLRNLRLKEQGFGAVVACQTAAAGLARLEQADHGFRLLFCDLKMPEMDGIGFLAEIAKLDYRGAVILLTGEAPNALASSRQYAESLGLDVVAAIEKPVSPERLAGLFDLLRQRTQRAEDDSSAGSVPSLAQVLAEGVPRLQYQPWLRFSDARPAGLATSLQLNMPDGSVFAAQTNATAEQDAASLAELHWRTLEMIAAELDTLRGTLGSIALSLHWPSAAPMPEDYGARVAKVFGADSRVPEGLTVEIAADSPLASRDGARYDLLSRASLVGLRFALNQFSGRHVDSSVLVNLPLDYVRLDPALLTRKDGAPHPLLAAAVGAARGLGLEVIAAGIDTAAQQEAAKTAGCTHYQGALPCQPMPLAALLAWLEPADDDAPTR